MRRSRKILAGLSIGLLSTLLAAWGFEILGGYVPCGLCLLERIPYYIAIVGCGAIALCESSQRGAVGMGVILSVILWFGSGLGGYHAGIEWGFWPGPSSCSSGYALPEGVPDLAVHVVQCTVAPWRFLGLSFAGWNAVICGLAGFGALGYARVRWLEK